MNVLLIFSYSENFRKKPQRELVEGKKTGTKASLGPEVPFEKLPSGCGCEAGRRECWCCSHGAQRDSLTLSSTPASPEAVF